MWFVHFASVGCGKGFKKIMKGKVSERQVNGKVNKPLD
jgi:hypothetical protein